MIESLLTDALKLLRGILVIDVWQESIKSHIGQLLIGQYQAVALVLDISEPLDEGSDRFIIPLSQSSQIGQL